LEQKVLKPKADLCYGIHAIYFAIREVTWGFPGKSEEHGLIMVANKFIHIHREQKTLSGKADMPV
jgi:hypothetical protein